MGNGGFFGKYRLIETGTEDVSRAKKALMGGPGFTGDFALSSILSCKDNNHNRKGYL